jgi:hypothetical protein
MFYLGYHDAVHDSQRNDIQVVDRETGWTKFGNVLGNLKLALM